VIECGKLLLKRIDRVRSKFIVRAQTLSDAGAIGPDIVETVALSWSSAEAPASFSPQSDRMYDVPDVRFRRVEQEYSFRFTEGLACCLD